MRSYLIYITFLSVVAFGAVVSTHSFQYADFELLIKGMRGNGKVWVFGNSVLKHSSKCDVDHSSIVDMISEVDKTKVLDLSRGGMPIGRMFDIIELLNWVGVKPKLVILQFPLEGNTSTIQMESTGIRTFMHSNFADMYNKILKSEVDRGAENVVPAYAGKNYGDYSTFSKQNFVGEKAHMSCPENIGYDLEFIRFMYWRNFIANRVELKNISILKQRLETLNRNGTNLIVWISPANITEVSNLLGDKAVRDFLDYRDKVIGSFERHQIVDTSNVLEAEEFVDRWCACGHMGEIGRRRVAALLNVAINNIN